MLGRSTLILVLLASVAAADGEARIEFFLRGKRGIAKERFVAAVAKALDAEGLNLKKLPRDYAKTIDGGFWYYGSLYWIHKRPRPRYKDAEKVAAGFAENPAARHAILEHRTWLALEATDTKNVAGDYRVLCRIAAELLGDDVLAIHFPVRKGWVSPIVDKGLAKKLRAKDPLKALGIGVTAEEQRKLDIARVEVDATKQARAKFGQFKKAFRKREKTGATTFAVTFKDPTSGEEISMSVKEIRGRRIKGFVMGKNFADWDKTIGEHEILDWSYRIGGKHHGRFRLGAIQAYIAKHAK